jgi:hypothetical protein
MSGLFRTWVFCFLAALGALAMVCVAGTQHLLEDATEADAESDPEPDLPSEAGDGDDVESDCDAPVIPAQRQSETLSAGYFGSGFGRIHDRPPISHVLDREPRPPCHA